jgi:hypothetical protein
VTLLSAFTFLSERIVTPSLCHHYHACAAVLFPSLAFEMMVRPCAPFLCLSSCYQNMIPPFTPPDFL